MGNKWVFLVKQNPNGSIARYKTRLVAKRFHQQRDIDFHRIFSLVINRIIVRIVLSIALNRKWGLFQLDVNNVFLKGHLTKEVYMVQSQDMRNAAYPHHVFTLHKAIYGLIQALQAWY